MVRASMKGANKNETMYFDAIPLNHGPNAFVSTSSGIVELDNEGCFLVKIANVAKHHVSIRIGELLGHISVAKDSLQMPMDLSEKE